MLLLIVIAVVAATGQDRRPTAGVDTFSGPFDGLAAAPSGPMTLWYRKPAADWYSALPIGNGRLGAMNFGGVEGERLQLNEDTLWTGGPYDPNNPEALAALPEVRKLIFDGRYQEAAKLINAKMMAKPLKQMAYQTVGDLRLAFPEVERVSNYRRELDISNAVARVSYRIGDTTYRREMFASAPDNAIVLRITADRKGKISFGTAFQSPLDSVVRVAEGNTLVLSGRNSDFRGIEGKLKFQARAKIVTNGGRIVRGCSDSPALRSPYSLSNSGRDSTFTERSVLLGENSCLSVKNADSATIVIAMATSYKNYRDTLGTEESATEIAVRAASRKTFASLLGAHVADYKKLFDRVKLDLGTTAAAKLPTNERIAKFATVDDPQLASLYFQYGRYLLIASSRPGTQPATLQGIWNDSLTPPWDSKYTININTEMNYWLAEPLNLGELTEPLVKMVEDLGESGQRSARVMYGARGWVVHHNTDIWRATAPIDGAQYGVWPTGGAWLTTHLWEHYEYSRDRAFLERVYPLMKGASEFFLDTLVKKPGTDYLVTNPSLSPENSHPFGTSVVDGPMMDSEIIRDLFYQTSKAAEVIKRDADLRKELAETSAKLPPLKIGKAGQLQEWIEDWDLQAKDPKHRHVSHLYAAFPSWQIDRRRTPELADAVRKTLDTRGDETTGWAIAWRLNLWARLGDGERAAKILALLLRPERTYPNMFDAHPPFQIDGNFGGANGIGEMLLQNHDEGAVTVIDLLPALPARFASGSVRGLRARGGLEIDLSWSGGKLSSATIRSKFGGKIRILYRGKVREMSLRKGGKFVFDSV